MGMEGRLELVMLAGQLSDLGIGLHELRWCMEGGD